MPQFHFAPLDTQKEKGTILQDARPLSLREICGAWQDAKFAREFAQAVAARPFDAFFWETPPAALGDEDQPFEFVLTSAPGLARVQPDSAPFQRQFAKQTGAEVLAFPNLGGDALLIVPAPIAAPACYTHLAAFLRQAPATQIAAFWRTAALALTQRLSAVAPAPVWLSTAGMGVSWLHLRLDSRPKYYRHQPYTVYPRK